MAFTTNLYGKFHDQRIKEHIELDEAATIDLNPLKRVDLNPDIAEKFTVELKNIQSNFVILLLANVPITSTTKDDGTMTLGGH